MTQASTNRRREDLGQPGPAMRALPNDRWRLFVETYLWETFTNGNKNNYGAQAAAARKAGFGTPRSKPITLAHIGWRLLKDDRMVAAVAEESRKLLRAGAPQAVKAVHDGILNPNHPSTLNSWRCCSIAPTRKRASNWSRSRTGPSIPIRNRLKSFAPCAARHATPKTDRTVWINGLDRLERLEAADKVRRANEAKMIEGEVIEATAPAAGATR